MLARFENLPQLKGEKIIFLDVYPYVCNGDLMLSINDDNDLSVNFYLKKNDILDLIMVLESKLKQF